MSVQTNDTKYAVATAVAVGVGLAAYNRPDELIGALNLIYAHAAHGVAQTRAYNAVFEHLITQAGRSPIIDVIDAHVRIYLAQWYQ